MRPTINIEQILALCAAALLAPGCSGTVAAPSLAGDLRVRLPDGRALPHRDRAKEPGWLSPEAISGKGLLYVGAATNAGGEVLIFKQRGNNQRPIGRITQGIEDALGVFVDKRRNLYAANVLNGTVTVSPPGGTAPFETLTGAGAPDNVVVGSDGSVYVSNLGNLNDPQKGAGSVLEYRKGETTPSKTIVAFTTRGTYPEGLALDSSDNLYVAFDHPTAGSKPQGEVLKFTQGAPNGLNLGIHVGYALGLTIDKSNDLLLVDGNSNCVDVFPPGSTAPSQQICGFRQAAIDGVALNRSNSELWVTNGFWSYIYGVTYPAGKIVDTISQRIGWAWGVATSPDGSN
jgi:hypothetical protein